MRGGPVCRAAQTGYEFQKGRWTMKASRILSFLLAVLMVCSLLPSAAFAAEPEEDPIIETEAEETPAAEPAEESDAEPEAPAEEEPAGEEDPEEAQEEPTDEAPADSREEITDSALPADADAMKPGETASVSICLDNSRNYNAMQFDIKLTGGLKLADLNASKTIRTKNHQIAINKIDEDTYRFVVFALNTADIEGYDGAVMMLNVSAGDMITGKSGIKIDNVYYADREQDYIADPSFTQASTITGVNEVSSEAEMIVRGDYRSITIQASTATTAQIVNASGMATTVTVAQGTNTYPLETGIYIVRIGNKTYKVVVK